jgi:hypothetical protein
LQQSSHKFKDEPDFADGQDESGSSSAGAMFAGSAMLRHCRP